MQERYYKTLEEIYQRFLWYRAENVRLSELLALNIKEKEREVLPLPNDDLTQRVARIVRYNAENAVNAARSLIGYTNICLVV